MTVEIKNSVLSVKIGLLGAELKSVIKNGEERLWNADPAFWARTAPVLFPMCGGLRENKFTHNGLEYILGKHGFAKESVFEVEKLTETRAVLLLKSNGETLKVYPWDFELRAIFQLSGSRISVTYEVKNSSNETMYFSIGGHEGYACPGGIENYDIVFEREEDLNTCELDGSMLSGTSHTVLRGSRVLPLYERYFSIDALVFKDVKSRFVTLRNRITGVETAVDFNGCDTLLVWTKPGAEFVCIEPWTAAPPAVGSDYELKNKEGITALSANGVYSVTRKIYF